MRNALLFDDVIQFTDFVRLYGSNTVSSRGFQLYHVRDPERPARTQLVLMGFRRRKGISLEDIPMISEEIQAEEKRSSLFVKSPTRARFAMEIQHAERSSSLIELVTLQAWKLDPHPGRVLFWLHDLQTMSKLVSDSFKLGNDRIQYAAIVHNQVEAMLLQIEQPSYYLLQWCQEQPQGTIELFHSPTQGFFVEWGYNHPLEDLWVRSQQPKPSEWLLFRSNNTREHIEAPNWQDIYKAAEFVFSFSQQELWLEHKEHDVKFTLPLRFEPRSRPLEPELWMLEEEDLPILERLLTLVDEDDLRTLLISIQQGSDGRHRYFIREKHLGEGRKFIDFQGRRFASYKGFHNLLLPTDWELQPQLRREQYRRLFELRNGELTVMLTDCETQSGTQQHTTQLLRIKENSFEPFTRLIDYIIQSNADTLHSILKKSIFDFGQYARAPQRSDLLHLSTPKKEKESTQSTKNMDTSRLQNPTKNKKKHTQTSIKKVKKQTEERVEQVVIEPSQLELEEARIERILIQKGQDARSWQELSSIKGLLNKWNDASTACLEGLWLTSAGEGFDTVRQEWTEWIDRSLQIEGTPAQRLREAQKQAQSTTNPMEVAAFVLHGRDEGSDRMAEWLQNATQLLRKSEDKMRKKERWLLWREIFLRNQDNREHARVKEAILKDLNQNGITNHDVPIFIQERLFQEQWLQDEEGGEANNEVGAAFQNLELLVSTIEQFPFDALRLSGLAILARAFSRIGHHPRAKELLESARTGMGDQELYTQAWIQLYSFQTIALQSKGEGKKAKEVFDKICDELKQTSKHQFTHIQKIATSLEERKELDNLSEYLSKESSKRLFPSSTSSASTPIRARFNAIEQALKEGELETVGKEVLSVLKYIQEELTSTQKSPDFRTLAWLLDSAITTLSKLKWGAEGRGLIHEFEDFVQAVPQQPAEDQPKLTNFYFTLLHLAMTEGLLTLGSEAYAMQHLQGLLQWTLGRNLVPLDFIDTCSKALNTIEAAQLKNRQEPLKLLMQGMLQQINTPSSATQYQNASFSLMTLRLIDQTVEVALSKEKLTLGLYKQYANQDELLLRERIFTEQLFK